jgi:hypothetical protein
VRRPDIAGNSGKVTSLHVLNSSSTYSGGFLGTTTIDGQQYFWGGGYCPNVAPLNDTQIKLLAQAMFREGERVRPLPGEDRQHARLQVHRRLRPLRAALILATGAPSPDRSRRRCVPSSSSATLRSRLRSKQRAGR